MSRITLVITFSNKELAKIEYLTNNLNTNLCKVPFGKVENREEVDSIPFHITLIAWDISQKSEILFNLAKIQFPKIKLLIDDIKIMNGKEKSSVLYFSIANNKSLQELVNKIYNELPSKNYSPDKLNFHITIHIDKSRSKIINMQKKMLENFKPFELEINEYSLYEIYPPIILNKYP